MSIRDRQWICCLQGLSPILVMMNGYRTRRLRQSLLGFGGAVIGLVVVLVGVLREVFVSIDVGRSDNRRLHDSDLSGQLNHSTGRLDSGLDAYGWYDRD